MHGVKLFLFFVPALMGALSIGFESVHADPSKYPQYAQQTLPAGVKPEFIKLDALVNEIVNRRTPIMIDVRSAEEYQEAHIKGAISIPLGEFESRVGEIPRDRPLVLY
jgi:3-mercaptopyruvate sulfurtransferase SseA